MLLIAAKECLGGNKMSKSFVAKDIIDSLSHRGAFIVDTKNLHYIETGDFIILRKEDFEYLQSTKKNKG